MVSLESGPNRVHYNKINGMCNFKTSLAQYSWFGIGFPKHDTSRTYEFSLRLPTMTLFLQHSGLYVCYVRGGPCKPLANESRSISYPFVVFIPLDTIRVTKVQHTLPIEMYKL